MNPDKAPIPTPNLTNLTQEELQGLALMSVQFLLDKVASHLESSVAILGGITKSISNPTETEEMRNEIIATFKSISENIRLKGSRGICTALACIGVARSIVLELNKSVKELDEERNNKDEGTTPNNQIS